jgi:hypothetical protein
MLCRSRTTAAIDRTLAMAARIAESASQEAVMKTSYLGMAVFGALAAVAAAPRQAHAAARVDWAVASADNTGGPYALNPLYSHNPTGAPITFSRLGAGDYQFVIEKGTSGLTGGGTVQVRAYRSSIRCTPYFWNNTASSVNVRVRCRNVFGALQDEWTIVQWYAASGTDARETAYLWLDRPSETTPYAVPSQYAYNSTGGTNVVSHGVAPGEYLAFLPGLTAAGGNPHVVSYGDTTSYCKIGSWYRFSLGTFVAVRCFDRDGDPADARWVLRYTNGHLADDGPHNGAYYLGDADFAPAVPAIHSYTPAFPWHAGGLAFSVLDENTYSDAAIPGLAHGVHGSVLVTAVGHDNVYCNNVGFYVGMDIENTHVRVQCFDPAGNVVGSRYTQAMWMER